MTGSVLCINRRVSHCVEIDIRMSHYLSCIKTEWSGIINKKLQYYYIGEVIYVLSVAQNMYLLVGVLHCGIKVAVIFLLSVLRVYFIVNY